VSLEIFIKAIDLQSTLDGFSTHGPLYSFMTSQQKSLILCYFPGQCCRYYIRKPVVKKKLSSEFPLTSPTMELLERVTNFVLNKTATQQPSFR